MENSILYAFLSVGAVSIISFVGVVTFAIRGDLLKKFIRAFVALAVGTLLGDAFIHLIPEALEGTGNKPLVSLAIIGGILLLFMLETILKWHHGHDNHGGEQLTKKTIGPIVFISDGIHNLIDGVIIGVSYLISVEVGLATTFAIILHEIPQEIGDFSVLIHAGFSRTKALLFNFASALFAVLGVAFAIVLRGVAEGFVVWAIPVAAGMFIYLAIADLLPELHHHEGAGHVVAEFFGVLAGVLAMYVLALVAV